MVESHFPLIFDERLVVGIDLRDTFGRRLSAIPIALANMRRELLLLCHVTITPFRVPDLVYLFARRMAGNAVRFGKLISNQYFTVCLVHTLSVLVG
ncbi:MAG: hypothetical protein H6R21_2160 [Proteobacteria bacterium]|nr:hypothetical protein [Pseudomonadota bacterium]